MASSTSRDVVVRTRKDSELPHEGAWENHTRDLVLSLSRGDLRVRRTETPRAGLTLEDTRGGSVVSDDGLRY